MFFYHAWGAVGGEWVLVIVVKVGAHLQELLGHLQFHVASVQRPAELAAYCKQHQAHRGQSQGGNNGRVEARLAGKNLMRSRVVRRV